MSTLSKFIIFPAIDLRDGQVVRLKEGDPNRQTNYSTEPTETARRWIEAGATWLHVVNLDGAFGQSTVSNMKAVEAILQIAHDRHIPVQFGGGMRSLNSIENAIKMGISRAVIGTLAVEEPSVLHEALNRWGAERIGVSLDAREGRVQTHGWQSDTPLLALDTAQNMADAGLRWLVFTDIARDGLQTGLNLQATIELAQASKLNVIASGGVSSLIDIREAQNAGLAGVIIGRALYEGSINPADLFPSIR